MTGREAMGFFRTRGMAGLTEEQAMQAVVDAAAAEEREAVLRYLRQPMTAQEPNTFIADWIAAGKHRTPSPKTPGQVAYEQFWSESKNTDRWDSLPIPRKESWEKIAAAVLAHAKEQP